MNHKLVLGLVIIGGIVLGGCQTTTPQSQNIPQTSTKPSVVTSPKPSASPISKDEAEIKDIGTELDQIDVVKDYPDFTQTDLQ